VRTERECPRAAPQRESGASGRSRRESVPPRSRSFHARDGGDARGRRAPCAVRALPSRNRASSSAPFAARRRSPGAAAGKPERPTPASRRLVLPRTAGRRGEAVSMHARRGVVQPFAPAAAGGGARQMATLKKQFVRSCGRPGRLDGALPTRIRSCTTSSRSGKNVRPRLAGSARHADLPRGRTGARVLQRTTACSPILIVATPHARSPIAAELRSRPGGPGLYFWHERAEVASRRVVAPIPG
jgi:hypothetical protein